MKTRWGSCTVETGKIRLNARLARKPETCVEYVLVHELCHLLEPSHNARFHRLMDGFLPDWQEEDDWRSGEDCPVCALRASFPEDASLSHRDFLGSILGLGLDREKVGDLLVAPGCCDILLLREIEDFLLLHLESAGRTRLKLKPIPLAQLAPKAVEVKTIRDTVATLRLDAVAASAFSLSRGRAGELISSGKLQLNYRECVKPDRAVAQGDVLSCRGLGKCVVKTVGGLSKKGRTMIELERYL